MPPRVLLADEPTAEQDADHRAIVLDELLAAADEGTTLVIATHDPEVADRCDRVIDLRAPHPPRQDHLMTSPALRRTPPGPARRRTAAPRPHRTIAPHRRHATAPHPITPSPATERHGDESRQV
ncbi:hypothetical protein GCM10020001_080720 [Nonomuraea salmonea]